MDSNATLKHLRWGCRRGMLELDLFLLPFFDHQYQGLNEKEKEDFRRLLDEQDTFLQSFLLEQAVHDDQRVQSIVNKVIQYRKSHPQTV